MATDWTSIRVRRSTILKLRAVVASLERAHNNGQYEPAYRHDVLVTIDDAINVLIDRDSHKRERARKSRERSRRADSQDNAPESNVEV